uniref:Macaca fascicularis brain cDNA clone: QmoA-10919, similar to human glutamate-ammonia ligase (glutamine synthase) (GLUL), mRNA, RefSeq: NM_002065.3 n=1 Tax=Macaca fascicularis TaxID=9541 RepID=I7GP77_MACFA|nr:unnamed protein product [Macaca fascicularis]
MSLLRLLRNYFFSFIIRNKPHLYSFISSTVFWFLCWLWQASYGFLLS